MMAASQVQHARSVSASVSELSYSMLSTSADTTTTASSSSFSEIIDDTSSDGEDQVIFGQGGSEEEDDEEDFVLVPYYSMRRFAIRGEHHSEEQDAHSDDDRGSSRSLECAMGRLNIITATTARMTPEPLSQPVTPITPTTPLRARSGQPSPASPSTTTSTASKANSATQSRRRRRKAAAARKLAVRDKTDEHVSNTSVLARVPTVARGRENAPEKKATAPRGRGRGGRIRRGRSPTPAESYPSPDTSPERALTEELFVQRGTTYRAGSHLVVESDAESEYAMMRYEDAKSFITSFLLNPSARTRLAFLQSLIIELGLLSPTSEPPTSMKAAKRIIKARAFVNIGDYLYAREKGPDELERIKFKSRKALTQDLRQGGGGKGRKSKTGNGRQVERGWVKRHGLNVLLVSVFGRRMD